MTKDIQGWLDANVVHYQDPINVVLSDFEVDWGELNGSFILALDDLQLEPRIRFSLDSTEWIRYWMPFYHSPLGVPCSYPMFEFSEATSSSIERALRKVFGRFRALGLNRDNGALITSSTPILDRVLSDNPIEPIKGRLGSADFSIAEPVIAA